MAGFGDGNACKCWVCGAGDDNDDDGDCGADAGPSQLRLAAKSSSGRDNYAPLESWFWININLLI